MWAKYFQVDFQRLEVQAQSYEITDPNELRAKLVDVLKPVVDAGKADGVDDGAKRKAEEASKIMVSIGRNGPLPSSYPQF